MNKEKEITIVDSAFYQKAAFFAHKETVSSYIRKIHFVFSSALFILKSKPLFLFFPIKSYFGTLGGVLGYYIRRPSYFPQFEVLTFKKNQGLYFP